MLLPTIEIKDTPANRSISWAVIGSRYLNVQSLFQKKLLHAATIQATELKARICQVSFVGKNQSSKLRTPISTMVLRDPTRPKRKSFTSKGPFRLMSFIKVISHYLLLSLQSRCSVSKPGGTGRVGSGGSPLR